VYDNTLNIIEEERSKESLILDRHGKPFVIVKPKNKMGFNLERKNEKNKL